MKKTNATMLTAAAFAAALAMAPGAGNSSADAASVIPESFDPSAVQMAALYGPPPSYWSTTKDNQEVITTQTTTAYQPEFYEDTTDDFSKYQLMYGPPPSYFTDIQPIKTTAPIVTYQAMYGPPGFFTDDIKPLGTTTTDDMFQYQLMYGPPSYFTTALPEITTVTTTYQTFQPMYGPTTTVSPVDKLREIEYNPDRVFTQPMYGPPPLYGDFNHDNNVNAFDLVLAKRLITTDEQPGWWEMKYNMDVNRDGKISLADVLLLNKYLLGQDVKLGKAPEDDPVTTTTQPLTTDPVTEVRSELYGVYGPPPSLSTATTAAVPDPIQEATDNMEDVYGPPPSYNN